MRLATAVLALLAAPSSAFRLPTGPPGGLRSRTAVRTRAMHPNQYDSAAVDHAQGLPRALTQERDACGVGFVAEVDAETALGSHRVVEQALRALGCMEHRGACSADRVTGDGSGVMTGIPWRLLADDLGLPELADNAGKRGADRENAAAMLFLPKDPAMNALARKTFEEALADRGELVVTAWREVPVDEAVLGPMALAEAPQIAQAVIANAPGSKNFKSGTVLETAVYLVRRHLPVAFAKAQPGLEELVYLCSMSTRTIVYKGMLMAEALGQFYTDLVDTRYTSRFAIYHRRFSTNTVPKWKLAQPMRLLGHNGEINTLVGNINWMRARAASQEAGCDIADATQKGNIEALIGCNTQDSGELTPVVDGRESDSANLDRSLELIVRAGNSPMAGLMTLVPQVTSDELTTLATESPDVAAFYEYFAGLQEAWDGPAAILFSDGRYVGATLDRNGLRPARFTQTKSGLVYVMSETGVCDIDDADVLRKGRLGPGEMICVDLEDGAVRTNGDIKSFVAAQRPYAEWVGKEQRTLATDRTDAVQRFGAEPAVPEDTLLRCATAFGWSSEDVDMQIGDMATGGVETTYCMGDDAPLAVLSQLPHVLYDYFKQRFAQVTNPAIDPLREGAVMSLAMYLGPRDAVLTSGEKSARLLKLQSPILGGGEMAEIKKGNSGIGATVTLSTVYDGSGTSLGDAVKAVCDAAVAAVASGDGAAILVLSDLDMRDVQGGDDAVGSSTIYIPPLLAVGAVHHALIENGLRLDTSIVIETGQAWSTHHYACLIGYGASAVYPYVAIDAVRSWHGSKRTIVQMEKGTIPSVTLEQAQANYAFAIDKGLKKVLAKMGISMLSSYHGAQIFEAIGIGDDLLALGFKGTASRVGGISVAELEEEVKMFQRHAYASVDPMTKLMNHGFIKPMPKLEFHSNSPAVAKLLHTAVRAEDKGEAYDAYKTFAAALGDGPVTTLRDLLDLDSDRKPISVDDVEPIEAIMSRFCTGGMSMGALSRESHEVLAVAMNRIGGKSNSGEGGEDPARVHTINDVVDDPAAPFGTTSSKAFPHLNGLRNGDSANSKIKQLASGRFGVTPEYLVSAECLEIKIAQGAKPGEGGQLPGKKVDAYIASIRASTPGVTLISPPPHHDIYSIEDLAQLIYDLKAINPTATVSVKLVGSVGIGTVSAGVCKALADVVQVSGHDGGTGASPLSSIKHAGGPWELGLTEVHRTLLDNGLRERALLRVDGGIRTGWDVVMGALMGAEEFGYGTVAMIAEGCVMARICHTNSCPVGVATQRADLRAKFPGLPEQVVAYFQQVAQEVRLLLAHLGYASLEDIIGRSDLLKTRDDQKERVLKTKGLDTEFFTNLPDVRLPEQRKWLNHKINDIGYHFDDGLIADPEVAAAVDGHGTADVERAIVNTDRSALARLSGHIAKKYGNAGFKGRVNLAVDGAAGQSFGAFLMPGIRVTLTGEANDYVGKGMHGGMIAVKPPAVSSFRTDANTIVGNTCLYGATGGEMYAAGRAGERFAVRNSGADAVVEGVGEHSCEYMTGGAVAVLGPAGHNIGAGMTGGLAYFVDDEASNPTRAKDYLTRRMNKDAPITVQRLVSEAGKESLRALLGAHVAATGSPKAAEVLADFDAFVATKLWQLVPESLAESPLVVAESDCAVPEPAAV